LTQKYYQGKVPTPGHLEAIDLETLAALKEFPAAIANSLEKYRFREASGILMQVARLGNKYLADSEPWKLVKTDPKRVESIMYVSLQIAAALAVLSEPFLPFTSNKLSEMLDLAPLDLSWKNVAEKEALLPSGHIIKEAQLLFRRIEDSEIDAQIQKLNQTKIDNAAMEATVVPQKDTSSFEDFSKLDLRTGTILSAEKMPKAKKLLVLQVQTGLDTRTIVSGIAEHFSPEEVVGKKVAVLVNLAPRVLRGVESEGMILMTEHKSGKLVFVNPDEDGVADGTVIS